MSDIVGESLSESAVIRSLSMTDGESDVVRLESMMTKSLKDGVSVAEGIPIPPTVSEIVGESMDKISTDNVT